MRNIAKKSVIILLVSLVIGAVIGCISRNTVYTENIQAFLGQLNEDKKIENLFKVVFTIECITVISLLFLGIKMSVYTFDKFKNVIYLVSEINAPAKENKILKNEFGSGLRLRI